MPEFDQRRASFTKALTSHGSAGNRQMNRDLPDYHGCLNLLHAIYSLWWRDAQHDYALMQQLSEWSGIPLERLKASRPNLFRTNRKDDLFNDD